MQSIGTIKRGDNFSFTAEIKDGTTGAALTGAADKLRCQGRHYISRMLLAELTVTETVTPGTYLFTASSVNEWEAGTRLLFDIEYTSEGVVSSSETFAITVEEDITHG